MVILAPSAQAPYQRFNSIETLLVDCKILSFQLCSSEPYLWAIKELSGYGKHHSLPFYRLFPCHSVGLFRHHGTGQYHVEEIASALLDEKDQSSLCFYHARMPLIDYLEGDIDQQDKLWPSALVNYYQDELLTGYACEHAWAEFSDDVGLHLMSGVRQVLATYLLQASALLSKGGFQAKQPSWCASRDAANLGILRHIGLGCDGW